MAYEFLKKLFGTTKEGEEPKAMTYAELEAAIEKDKNIKIVNLTDGEYVSKSKLDANIEELKGVKQQLNDANAQINSFKDQDVEGIKQKVSEWETKYNTDTQALNDKLAAQARSHAEELFLTGYKFSSKAAKKGVLDELRAKKFQVDENGTILGAKEFMKSLMEDEDYKGAFVTDDTGNDGAGAGTGANGSGAAGTGAAGGAGAQGGLPGAGAGNLPRFAQGANTNQGADANPFMQAGFGFTRIRQPENK